MPGQSEPGSSDNEGVLRIPQSPSITGTSPSDCLVSYPEYSFVGSYPSAEKQSVYSGQSDCLVSYPGHSLEGSYLSAEKQSVYSTALADWAKILWTSLTKK